MNLDTIMKQVATAVAPEKTKTRSKPIKKRSNNARTLGEDHTFEATTNPHATTKPKQLINAITPEKIKKRKRAEKKWRKKSRTKLGDTTFGSMTTNPDATAKQPNTHLLPETKAQKKRRKRAERKRRNKAKARQKKRAQSITAHNETEVESSSKGIQETTEEIDACANPNPRTEAEVDSPSEVIQETTKIVEGSCANPNPRMESEVESPSELIQETTEVVEGLCASPNIRMEAEVESPSEVIQETTKVVEESCASPNTNSETGGILMLGSNEISHVTVRNSSDNPYSNTFFGFLVGDRCIVVIIKKADLLDRDKSKSVDRFIRDKDHLGRKRTYELVFVKEKEDKSDSFYGNTKEMELLYVLVEAEADKNGKSLKKIDLKMMLERFGNFAILNTRKCASRLELLTSPGSRFPDGSFVQVSL